MHDYTTTLRARVGDYGERLVARWLSFMYVSVYLETEPPTKSVPILQTTLLGALVRLLFHELHGLVLRWSSTGARES
jgi:hypothetical protein